MHLHLYLESAKTGARMSTSEMSEHYDFGMNTLVISVKAYK